MRGTPNACLILLVGCLSLVMGRAENVVLHLRNGDRLTGTIVAETTNQVTVLTLWQEKVAVPAAQIERREKLPPPASPATAAPKPAAPKPPAVVITQKMQQELDELLALYQADRITAVQYQEHRASILAEASAPPPPAAQPTQIAGAKPGQTPTPGPSPGAPVPSTNPPAAKPPAPAPAAPPKVAAKKEKRWKATINLGANAVFNQTDNQLYTLGGKWEYVRGRFHELVDYAASYGEANGMTSANQMYGSEKTDFDLGTSRKFFAYNLADGGYDQMRKIDILYGAGPGIGYHLIGEPNKPNTKFILDGKVGGKYEQFDYSDGRRTEDVYVRLAENIVWHPTPKATVTEEFAFLAPEFKFSRYQFHLDSTLSYALSAFLSLNLHVVDFYDTLPAVGVSHNSLQINSTLGLNF